MPRYCYVCSACGQPSQLFHLSDEIAEECPACGALQALTKVLTPFHTAGKEPPRRAATGELTERSIKEAKRELKKQKADLMQQKDKT